MAEKSQQINWKEGSKAQCITATTWSTKNTEQRLQAAREDLRRAGFTREADLLTTSRLNGAWYTLAEGDRMKYMAARTAANPRKRAADRDDERLARTKGEISLLFFSLPQRLAVLSCSCCAQSPIS